MKTANGATVSATSEFVSRAAIVCLVAALRLGAADPTFLYRYVPRVQPQPDELTKEGRLASYRPVFGIGDAQVKQLKGIARYGELTVGPGGATAAVQYPAEGNDDKGGR